MNTNPRQELYHIACCIVLAMADSSLDNSMAVLAALPEPDYVTLLFKNQKSTTLLSVPPTQPFAEVKSLLLAALKSRRSASSFNISEDLPDDPNDLEFGVLVDRKDPSKGWVAMEVKEQEITDTKGGKRKIGGKKSILNESPLGAGLIDGSLVAYRVKASKQKSNSEDQDIDSLADVDIEEDPGWDVILPSFDDEEGE